MSGFLRGKQTGIQNDLSAGITPDSFMIDDQARFGINSQISCMAYDPVQSLLAIGTSESKFAAGQITIFGQGRVSRSFRPTRATSFQSLHFAGGDRLVSLDKRGEIAVWDLASGSRASGGLVPGMATCLTTDPMLDWALIGVSNGDVLAYDVDRGRVASAFRLPNFWRQREPASRGLGAVDVRFHPRDVGQLLVAYPQGVAIYSLKQEKVLQYLQYVVPRGAPGGNGQGVESTRSPRVTHARWHPTGTFVLTAHDDGSLVFWDPKEGRVLMARTLMDVRVDQPVKREVTPTLKEPFSGVDWCCKENPDDTGLLVAGGHSPDEPQGLTFIELGPTPIYATSSWQALSDHFHGKRTIPLLTPPGTQVVSYQLLPRTSPYFAGAQDPIAIMSLLSSGELLTMSFPSGYPISPTNQLHPSVSFVHPFVTKIAVTTVSRDCWVGLQEARNSGEALLRGGAEAGRPRRRFDGRTVLQVAHGDGTVRIWDSGHGDEIENEAQLQVDLARALDRYDDVAVSAMAMAPSTGEFVAGTPQGEVVIYRWGENPFHGRESSERVDPNPGGLTPISSRAEPPLKIGLQPAFLYEMAQGPITALSVSDVGFVAVGSEMGRFSIIDLRGPAVIYQASMSEFAKQEKRSSFLKHHSATPGTKEWPVVIEFGVMTIDEDKYSSIACFVGTNAGKVITFRILPSGEGYAVKPAGVTALNDKVVSISPIVANTGNPAAATGETVAALRTGKQVNGVLAVVTQSEIRVFKPTTTKGATKTFDAGVMCHAANVTTNPFGSAVVGVFSDGTTRAYSLPGLKELGKADLLLPGQQQQQQQQRLDPGRLPEALVTENGYVFGWTGPSELALLHVWGVGQDHNKMAGDLLVNPDVPMPPRPTISNLQWISGTQYMSPADLDCLIGGPDRPPSKRMLDASAAEQRAARQGGGGGASSPAATGGAQEGWGQYLTRQLNERTDKLNIMDDTMDSLTKQSQGWADDVSKFVKKQQRNAVLGGIKGKFS